MIESKSRAAFAVSLFALCFSLIRPASGQDQAVPPPPAPPSSDDGHASAAPASQASQEADADAQIDRMWEEANQRDAAALKNAMQQARDCRSTPNSADCENAASAEQLRQEGDRCLHRIERRIARLEHRSEETTQQNQAVSTGGCTEAERTRRQWAAIHSHGCVEQPPLITTANGQTNAYQPFDAFSGQTVYCPGTELSDLQLALALVAADCEPERSQRAVTVRTARAQAASDSLSRAQSYLTYATDRRNAMNGDNRLGPLSRILERIQNSARASGALPGNAHVCWSSPGPARSNLNR